MKVWDDELAYLAGLTSRSCSFGGDQCRNTGKYLNSDVNKEKKFFFFKAPNSIKIFNFTVDKFKRVGQSTSNTGTSGNYQNANNSIRGAVLSFYNQYKNADMNDILSFHDT